MALLIALNARKYLKKSPGHVSVQFDSIMFAGPDGQFNSSERVPPERSPSTKDTTADFQLYPPRLEVEIETTTSVEVSSAPRVS